MHKRDYELIAAAIRESEINSMIKTEYSRGYNNCRVKIINDISIILGIENTRFNVNKFKSACNR